MITSKHSKKITSSNPPVIVVLLLIPPSSPTNRLRLIRPLSIYPVGCCVCYPSIVAAMIARDEWIYCLFFVELSIPLGWLSCCFKPSPIVVWFFLFLWAPMAPVLPAGGESSARAIVRSLVAAPSRWLCQRLRHNNDASTAADERLIHRGKMVWFLGMKWWCMVAAAMVSRWLLVESGVGGRGIPRVGKRCRKASQIVVK